MMQCTKTGCHVYDMSHNQYFWGDAFECNGVALFRTVSKSFKPFAPVIHFTVSHFDLSFKDDVSTMVATVYTNHGYDGVAVKAEDA